MLRRMLAGVEMPWTFRQDGPAGGGGEAAVLEGDGGDAGAGDLDDGGQADGEILDDGDQGDGSDAGGDDQSAQGGEGDDSEGQGGASAPSAKAGDQRSGKVRTGATGQMIPYARFKQLVEQVTTLKDELAAVKDGATTTKPTTDPLDDLLEQSFPKGEEGSPERKLYEDAKEIVGPILKHLRPALLPEVKMHERALAGTLQALDRIRFEMKQLMDAVLPKGKDGKSILPPGLAKLDRIDGIRKEVFERSGGRRLISHQDAFQELQQQLEDEVNAAAEREGTIRQDERSRTLRETTSRRAASGGSGPGAQAGRVPRGTPSGGRRTFDQLENGPDVPIG